MRLDGSIFNYAFIAMIHPAVVNSWPKTGEFATGFDLTMGERESLFQGAVALVFIQIIMIGLVISEMIET